MARPKRVTRGGRVVLRCFALSVSAMDPCNFSHSSANISLSTNEATSLNTYTNASASRDLDFGVLGTFGFNADFGGGDNFDFNAIDWTDPMFDFMDQLGDVGSGVSDDSQPSFDNPQSTMQPLFLPSPGDASASTVNETDTLGNNSGLAPTSAPAPVVHGLNGCDDNGSPGTHTLSKSFTAFEPTAHATHNPLLPTQSTRLRLPRRNLTAAQSRTLNEAKAEKTRLAMSLKEDVVKLLEEYEANIASLADKHHVNVERVKQLFTTVSELKHKRAPGRMQALLHIKAQEVNATLPVGQKKKVPELRRLVNEDRELLALSNEQLEKAKREVEEKRILSTRGIRPNIASAGKDFSATARQLKNEFDFLHLRTGAVGFGLLAPGSCDDRGRPIWFVSGNDTVEFVRKNLNVTMWDLLGRLELWASTRKSDKPPTIPELHAKCSSIIASGLRFILSNKTMKMNYSSYHQSIVGKHHVRLVGLPDLPVFNNANGPVQPFEIKDHGTLEALHTVLESGVCHWARMSQEEITEHNEWLKTQVVKERAVRNDKGRKRGPRERAEDENENENEVIAGPSKKRARANKNPSSSTNRQRSSTKTKAASSRKSRVSKRLPPQPRSRSVITDDEDDDDDDDEGEGSNSQGSGPASADN